MKLPLFPLNTVLFPRMPLTLHIFEDRYKLMIGRCIAEKTPFGVILLQKGSAEHLYGQEIVPYLIGCTAEIHQVQPVGMGRMNILAMGQERFRILAFDESQPYLTGEVESIPFKMPDPATMTHDLHILRGWVERYLNTLSKTESLQIDYNSLPHDALGLTFLAASLVKVSVHEKQSLLASSSSEQLIHKVNDLYRKEVTLMNLILSIPEFEVEAPFSAN